MDAAKRSLEVSDPPANAGEGDAAPHRPDPKRLFHASVPLLVLLAMAFAPFPVCPSVLFFGIPCPGCGLSRATIAGMQLDFGAMLAFHPLAPILTPMVAWAFTKPVLKELFGDVAWLRRTPTTPMPLAIALAIALFGLWFLRLFGLVWHPDAVDPSQGLIWWSVSGLWHAMGLP